MDENEEQSMNESKEWFVSESEEWSKNKNQFMNDEWSLNEQYVSDEHLGTICAFFVTLIICIMWMTISPPLLVPTNLNLDPSSLFLMLKLKLILNQMFHNL